MILMTIGLNAQEYEWEMDRFKRKEIQRKKERDSILVHIKDIWELKLSLGRWHFSKSAKSNEDEFFFLSEEMNAWQITSIWHVKEKISANISVGLQFEKEVPSNAAFFPAIFGNDIEVEGYGALLLPIDVGIQYYFLPKRFRPFVGVNSGIIVGSSQYTLAEGNINDGIIRTDYQVRDVVWLVRMSTGFDYRIGRSANFSLNFSYYVSEKFREPIGGYWNFNGFLASAGLSILILRNRK